MAFYSCGMILGKTLFPVYFAAGITCICPPSPITAASLFSFSIEVGFLPFNLDKVPEPRLQGTTPRLFRLRLFRRLWRGRRPRFPPFHPNPRGLRDEARENGPQRELTLSHSLPAAGFWGLSRLGLGSWWVVRKVEQKADSRELSRRIARSPPADAQQRRKLLPLEVGGRVAG